MASEKTGSVAQSDLKRVTLCAQRQTEARGNLIDAMRVAKDSGETYEDIGKAAGMTRQSVYQLLNPRSRKSKPPQE